jgi:hypothetical protein
MVVRNEHRLAFVGWLLNKHRLAFLGWLLLVVAHQMSVHTVWAEGIFILLATALCALAARRFPTWRWRDNAGVWAGAAIAASYLLRAAIQGNVLDTTLLWRYAACWLLFVCWLSAFRRPRALRICGAALLTACVLEMLCGAAQLTGLLGNSNDRFTLGGTIGTPSAYGSYLGVMAPVLLALALEGNFRLKFPLRNPCLKFPLRNPRLKSPCLKRLIASLLFVLLLVLLAYSLSRSGWIAASLGCGMVLNRRFALVRRLRLRLRTPLLRAVAVAALLLTASGAVVALYQLKSDSVEGRALIWKVTLQSPDHYRLWGGGPGYFAAHYNRWQADYFADGGGTPRERWLGDYVGGAYNVFIDLLMDDGVAVLLCFVALLLFAFRQPTARRPLPYFALKASLAGMVVVLSVSFLFPLLYLWMLFCLAALYAGGKSSLLTLRQGRWILPGALLLVTLCCARLLYGSYLLDLAGRAANRADIGRSLSLLRLANPVLGDRASFNVSYAKIYLTRDFYPEAIAKLETALRQEASPATCLLLAYCYQKNGDLPQAAETYTLLSNMIPHKIRPRYLLAQVLFEMKAYDRAKALALEIAEAPQKVVTDRGEQIKAKAVMLIRKINKKLKIEN